MSPCAADTEPRSRSGTAVGGPTPTSAVSLAPGQLPCYSARMHFSRTIVSWLLLVSALIAGVPACGFAWCLEGDGSLRVEATDPEGRCVDAAGSSAAVTPATRKARPAQCVVLAGAQWEIVSNPDGAALLASAAAGYHAAVWYVAIPVLRADALPEDLGGDDARTPSDTVLIRETVALLI